MELSVRLPGVCLRRAEFRDIPALKQLFQETVLSVNRQDYTEEEVTDWASCGDNDERWEQIVLAHYTLVAKNEKGNLLGFTALSAEGYLNSIFVHKDFQGQGIASALYSLVEKRARAEGVNAITADISLTAYPFFKGQGFVVEEVRSRKANRLCLKNYRMVKYMENGK
jgi:putative acetyltransferase